MIAIISRIKHTLVEWWADYKLEKMRVKARKAIQKRNNKR